MPQSAKPLLTPEENLPTWREITEKVHESGIHWRAPEFGLIPTNLPCLKPALELLGPVLDFEGKVDELFKVSTYHLGEEMTLGYVYENEPDRLIPFWDGPGMSLRFGVQDRVQVPLVTVKSGRIKESLPTPVCLFHDALREARSRLIERIVGRIITARIVIESEGRENLMPWGPSVVLGELKDWFQIWESREGSCFEVEAWINVGASGITYQGWKVP